MTKFADILPKKKVSSFFDLLKDQNYKEYDTGLTDLKDKKKKLILSAKKTKKKWCAELTDERIGWRLATIVLHHPGQVNGVKNLNKYPNIFEYDGKYGEILGHATDEYPDFPVCNYFIDFEHTDELLNTYEECTKKEQFYEYLKKYPLICGAVCENGTWKSKLYIDTVKEKYICDFKCKSRHIPTILYENLNPLTR